MEKIQLEGMQKERNITYSLGVQVEEARLGARGAVRSLGGLGQRIPGGKAVTEAFPCTMW